MIVIEPGIHVLFVFFQKDHDTQKCGEQDVGLAQSIKSPVIQDHACHNIDGAGLLQSVFNVTVRYLNRPGVFLAVLGQQCHRIEQYADQGNAADNGHGKIDLIKALALRTYDRL